MAPSLWVFILLSLLCVGISGISTTTHGGSKSFSSILSTASTSKSISVSLSGSSKIASSSTSRRSSTISSHGSPSLTPSSSGIKVRSSVSTSSLPTSSTVKSKVVLSSSSVKSSHSSSSTHNTQPTSSTSTSSPKTPQSSSGSLTKATTSTSRSPSSRLYTSSSTGKGQTTSSSPTSSFSISVTTSTTYKSSTSSALSLTGVSTQDISNPSSCYTLSTPTASLQLVTTNSTVNTTLGAPLELFLDPSSYNVVYLGLQINSSQYLYDISGIPSQIAVIFLPAARWWWTILAFTSPQAIAVKNKNKRTESAFQVYLQLTNQCNALVTNEIFPTDALKVGKSPCTLLPAPQTNQNIGVWAFTCLYPGLNSPEGAWETPLINELDAFDSKMGAIGKALGKFQYIFSSFPVAIDKGAAAVGTTLEGIDVVLSSVGKVVSAVQFIGPARLATFYCSFYADPPYSLTFTPSVGANAISLLPLETAPTGKDAIMSFALTIQDPAQPPDCGVCVPPNATALAETNWNQTCNLLINPSFDLYDNAIGGPRFDPWSLGIAYQNFWFGGGGPSGMTGCASGLPGDQCATIQTYSDGEAAELIQPVNISFLQSGTYTLGGYVQLLELSGGPITPGDSSAGCNVTMALGFETAYPPPAKTYYSVPAQPGFDVLDNVVQIAFDMEAFLAAVAQGLAQLSDFDPWWVLSMQCGIGVSGTFVLDNLSLCLEGSPCPGGAVSR